MSPDAVLLLIIFGSALTTGLTGFGFNLVSVPLLALYLEPRTAVVISLLLGVAASAILLIPGETRREVDTKLALLLFGSSVVGLPLGVALFTHASPNLLKAGIGVITLAYALPLLWTRRFRLSLQPGYGVVAGFMGGVLASSTGLSGPPAIVFVHSRNLEPARMRATLALYVLLVTIATLPLLWYAGWLSTSRTAPVLPLIPAAVVGVVAGRLLFRRLPAGAFHTIVVAALLLMGVANLVASAGLL